MKNPGRFIVVALVLSGTGAWAQWVTQSFDLQAGWNSIYLHVQPEPADCESVVAGGGLGIDQIMTYNDSFSSVQFIQNVSEADVGNLNDSWLRWGASSNINITSEVPLLHAMAAGRAYMVYANSAGRWDILGRPLMKPVAWRAGRLNLIGFSVYTNSPPSFEAFFADCGGVDLAAIYRLSTNGTWENASKTNEMVSGEAFWIETIDGVPDFQGAVSVSTGTRYGLDFGKSVVELPLNINVEGADETEIFINPSLSERNPNSEDYDAYAGPAPLMWWNPEAGGGGIGNWEGLTNEVSLTVPGTNTTTLRFAVLRREFADYTAPAGMDPIYTRLLHISDRNSLSINIPVSATGASVPAELEDTPFSEVGLWIGEVVIDKVSHPYPTNNLGAVGVAGGGEYSFRILLHSSSNGVVHLLSHAALVWYDGEYGEPDEHGFRTMEPGYYGIIGNDALIPEDPDSHLNRRFSSAAFSHPLPLASDDDSTENSIRFLVCTPYNDPRSPYVHTYHPMHDNLKADGSGPSDERYSTHSVAITNMLGEVWDNIHINTNTTESFSVTRSIDMAFAIVSPGDPAAWGAERLGGEWREVITGLHSKPLEVSGSFIIQLIKYGDLEY